MADRSELEKQLLIALLSALPSITDTPAAIDRTSYREVEYALRDFTNCEQSQIWMTALRHGDREGAIRWCQDAEGLKIQYAIRLVDWCNRLVLR